MPKMTFLFRIILTTVLFQALIQNGHSKTITKTPLMKEREITIEKLSNKIEGWSISKKTESSSDKFSTIESNNKIKSWYISEDGQNSSNGYLWSINIKISPYSDKSKAGQAGINLIKKLRKTLTLLPKDIPVNQPPEDSKVSNSKKSDFSWAVNFKLWGYKSKDEAEQVAQNIKATQIFSNKISVKREPFRLNEVESKDISKSKISGEISLTRNTKPVDHRRKQFILVMTGGNSLNVREKPSSLSSKISSLPNGSKVPYVRSNTNLITDGSWFQVEYLKGKFGWVSSSFSQIEYSEKITSQNIALKTIKPNKNQLNGDIKPNISPKPQGIPNIISPETNMAKADHNELTHSKVIKTEKINTLNHKYSKQIKDLQKTIATLHLEKERNAKIIADIRRSNVILRMEKKFRANSLLEMEAEKNHIQNELNKIRLNYSKFKEEKYSNTDIVKKLEVQKPKQINNTQNKIVTKDSTNDNTPEKTIAPYLKKWTNAWESRNISQYLSFYSIKFKDSNNKSRIQWEDQRRKSINNSLHISIEITDIKTIIINNMIIKSTFLQKYESNIVSDIGIKEIFWEKENSTWKIIKETWKPHEK
jgi:hypothetical protein